MTKKKEDLEIGVYFVWEDGRVLLNEKDYMGVGYILKQMDMRGEEMETVFITYDEVSLCQRYWLQTGYLLQGGVEYGLMTLDYLGYLEGSFEVYGMFTSAVSSRKRRIPEAIFSYFDMVT